MTIIRIYSSFYHSSAIRTAYHYHLDNLSSFYYVGVNNKTQKAPNMKTLTLTQQAANIQKLLETQESLHPIYQRKLSNLLYKLDLEIKQLTNLIIGDSK